MKTGSSDHRTDVIARETTNPPSLPMPRVILTRLLTPASSNPKRPPAITGLTIMIFFGLCLVWAKGSTALETKKLTTLLSASETRGNDASVWTYAWAMDGEWQAASLNITVDSDYSRSANARLDRLRTGFRFMDRNYGKVKRKWYPLILIQTEGDHSFQNVNVLNSVGFRQERKYGYLEFTGGVSKDIKTDEDWVGDLGFQVGYDRKFGKKWRFKTGPKAETGILGNVRIRPDRVRYSWDASLDYQLTPKVGIGYQLWVGNTVPNSERTQWFGITIGKK